MSNEETPKYMLCTDHIALVEQHLADEKALVAAFPDARRIQDHDHPANGQIISPSAKPSDFDVEDLTRGDGRVHVYKQFGVHRLYGGSVLADQDYVNAAIAAGGKKNVGEVVSQVKADRQAKAKAAAAAVK